MRALSPHLVVLFLLCTVITSSLLDYILRENPKKDDADALLVLDVINPGHKDPDNNKVFKPFQTEPEFNSSRISQQLLMFVSNRQADNPEVIIDKKKIVDGKLILPQGLHCCPAMINIAKLQ